MGDSSNGTMSLRPSASVITPPGLSSAVTEADSNSTSDIVVAESNTPENSFLSPVESQTVGGDGVLGVETNVESRFVDYTLATPWEQLCADIERAIKAWGLTPAHSSVGAIVAAPPAARNIFNIGGSGVTSSKKDIEIEYQGERFRLVYVERADSNSRERNNSSINSNATHALLMGSGSSVHQLMHWLGGLQSCLLMAPVQSAVPSSSLSMTSSSARRVIFSALVCAMDSCRCPLPGLVASTSIDTLHRAREILGYAICPPSLVSQKLDGPVNVHIDVNQDLNNGVGSRNNNSKINDSNKLLSSGRTVHFESGLLEGVAPKQELYYADGLLHMFSSKLHGFSNGVLTMACGSSFIQVIH